MFLSSETLTSIIRADLPILAELIDLVNSVIIFWLTWMVNFPTCSPDCDSHSPAYLNSFLSCGASICSAMAFPPLANSDHVVSVSIDFPSNSQRDAPFRGIAYDYSRADWDSLCDHLRDVPWEDIFKFGASALTSEFCEWFRLELMYISPIENIWSNLTHLHGFQLVCCCHSSKKSLFFVCTKRINLLILK